ncbi:MAG: hypothetical protein AAGF12_34345 [Myxococcota bacterium]
MPSPVIVLGPHATVAPLHLRGAPPAFDPRPVPARLPGSVQDDLRRAGRIDDDFYRPGAEGALRFIQESDWVYDIPFEYLPETSPAHIELVFDRIDTVAEVRLNGTLLGHIANAHHAHRFSLGSNLLEQNRVEVRVFSAARYAREHEARLGPLPFLNTSTPFNFVRKPAYHFGWDWAPDLGCVGLLGARVEGYAGPRIDGVRPTLSRKAGTAALSIAIDGRLSNGDDVSLELFDPRGTAVGRAAAEWRRGEGFRAELNVDAPELWWPRGYGDAPLYRVDIEARSGGASEHRSFPIGLRTVHARTEGGGFTLEVNGKPILVKGLNWVPNHCLTHQAEEPERFIPRIEDAIDAGANLLRVWGGASYASDAFLDACDRRGVLVWQDFPFACACYPEEPPFDEQVRVEAETAVRRVARHPSLVVYSGCNENLWGYVDWGWRNAVAERSWGRGYYFGVLADVCSALDPSRPYLPGSPYSGTFSERGEPHPNAPELFVSHVWDAFEGADHPVVGKVAPRFCAEYGFQGPPGTSALPSLDFSSAAVMHHQRSDRAEARVAARLAYYFGEVIREHQHAARSLAQARYLIDTTDWFRAHHPVCGGAIYWQLNDCWPALSWSLVDHRGERKLAFHALRQLFAPRRAAFVRGPAGPRLVLMNDTDDEWSDRVEVGGFAPDGARRQRWEEDFSVPPRENLWVEGPPLPLAERLWARAGDVRGDMGPGPEPSLPEPRFGLEVDGHDISVTAETLLVDAFIEVLPDAAPVSVDGQLQTLAPGETGRFELSAPAKVSVRTANHLVRSGG